MDKFTKVRNIGKGNMGTCALARSNEDDKYYVIKQVDLTRMSRKERQQALNEARLLSSMRHPNIINYVDSFLARKSDHLCIVMEYADGGDLTTRIKKNYGVNFRENQVLDWLIQLILSLHYVHQRKILHRDVKTQNVFLTSGNVVKLGDFGIARTLSSTYDQAKTFVGTPYYLSPELILERPYDHRSDVWALGVVLYELLTLKHPFIAQDMKGLMQRILKVQYDPVPLMYTMELRNIVPRLLTRNPAQRIGLEELLEMPILHRRMCEWLKGDIVPRRYLDAVVAQCVLPETVLAVAGHDIKPGLLSAGAEAAMVANSFGTSAIHSVVQLPPAGVAVAPKAAKEVNVQRIPAANDVKEPSSSGEQRENSYPSVAKLSPASPGIAPIQSGMPQSCYYKNIEPNCRYRVKRSKEEPLPLSSPAIFRPYKPPHMKSGGAVSLAAVRKAYLPAIQRPTAPLQRPSVGYNYFPQQNLYQPNGRCGGLSAASRSPTQVNAVGHMYSNRNNPYSGRSTSSNYASEITSTPRTGGPRQAPGQSPSACALAPLLRPSNGCGAPPKVYDAAQKADIKALLQRAALERAKRRVGGNA